MHVKFSSTRASHFAFHRHVLSIFTIIQSNNTTPKASWFLTTTSLLLLGLSFSGHSIPLPKPELSPPSSLHKSSAYTSLNNPSDKSSPSTPVLSGSTWTSLTFPSSTLNANLLLLTFPKGPEASKSSSKALTNSALGSAKKRNYISHALTPESSSVQSWHTQLTPELPLGSKTFPQAPVLLRYTFISSSSLHSPHPCVRKLTQKHHSQQQQTHFPRPWSFYD